MVTPSTNGNGVHTLGNGTIPPEETELSPLVRDFRRVEEIVSNITTARQEWRRRMGAETRNIDKECGYPDAPDARYFYDMYTREPIANQVVKLIPRETHQVQPLVYEDEKSDVVTDFEIVWDKLGSYLRGERSHYKKEAGSGVMEYLKRLDEMSGIGSYGVLLFGFDDITTANGKTLADPVDDVVNAVMRIGYDDEGEEVAGPNTEPGSGGTGGKNISSGVGKGANAPFQPGGAESTSEDTYGGPHTSAFVSVPTGGGAGSYQSGFGGLPEKGSGGAKGSPAPSPEPSIPGSTASKKPPSQDTGAVGEEGQTEFISDTTESETSPDPDREVKTKRHLRFIRVFPEHLAPISAWENDLSSPRYGLPKTYLITFNDPVETTQQGGTGLATGTQTVHWSRVLHAADNLGSSEVFGVPRLRPVINRVIDLRKVYGSSAEGFWQSCFAILSFETNPQLGGDVNVDVVKLRAMAQAVRDGLQREFVTSGLVAKSLAPSVVAPGPHVETAIEAIAMQMNCPIRILKGSERGELASTQDDAAWNDRLKERQNNYVTPRIIVPFVDRLINAGVLPEPVDGYTVEWPDLTSHNETEQAQTALLKVQAMVAFFVNGLEAMCSPLDFWTKIMGWPEEEAQATVDAAMEWMTEHGGEMAPAQPPAVNPVTGEPMDPNAMSGQDNGGPSTAPGDSSGSSGESDNPFAEQDKADKAPPKTPE